VAWRVPYGLDLTVRAVMTGAIGRIESTSHPVSVSVTGNNATVTLSQRDAALDRDFVLSVEAAGLEAPHGWIESEDDGTEAVAVAFAPAFRDASAPGEIVFLVDRSGSMGGQSIAEVRNALQLCLRSMIPGCFFNIVGFGSKFEALFYSSRPYDERSLADASEHVAGLGADLGGTEILPALTSVLEQPPHAGLPRQVVILTDGEVSNTDAVLGLAAAHAGDARIFTFGIGASASHHLVKGLARAGGGVAEFIYPGERIEAKVVRQFGRLLSPAMTDVRVEWQGLDVTQAPSAIPPIFSGGRLLLYGLLKRPRAAGRPVGARLSAHSPSGPVSFDVAIDPAVVRPGRTVATLAARARIRELEESPAWTKARGSRQAHRKDDAVRREIIALSTRYSVISRETSFVAVERRETPVEGGVQLRKVPIALAVGWGGLDVAEASALMDGTLAPPQAARAGGAFRSVQALSSAVFRRRAAASEATGSADMSGASVPLYREHRDRIIDDPVRERLISLIMLQRADGSWEMSSELERLIGRDSFRPGLQIAGATPLMKDFQRVWATALALAWLERHADHLRGEWGMAAEKSRRWLRHAVAEFGESERWVHEAAKFV
jgi:Ca-activated chloride channel family protein